MSYVEEEVTFTNGDITLAGTLTIPERPGRHPAVVMITGSGPLNRDEECFGMKPFRSIADHFARKGIAVLRYDSRGVGGSTGDLYSSTLLDFAEDVRSAICYLRTRDDIDPVQIGLCGHSEGGAVAPLCASRRSDVAFIVCIAGLGHTGAEILLAQGELMLRADGATEEEIGENLASQKLLLGLIREGGSEAQIKSAMMKTARLQLQLKSDEEKKGMGDIEEILRSQVDAMFTQFSSPWLKFFLDYDPRPALENVKCPVLLLFGDLDLQVPAEMSKKAMVDALERGGNNEYAAKIFPRANHLFQNAETGSPSEYVRLPKKFISGFLEFMSDWILEQVDTVK